MNTTLEHDSILNIESKEIALKKMCKDAIRKDFEIIKIQNHLSYAFGDIEFYSHYHDEFSSIEMAIYLAFNQKTKELIKEPFYYIIDCGLKLAFNYNNAKGCVLTRMKYDACALVDLIFQAAEKGNAKEAKIHFLTEFINSYPHLNLEDAKAELNDELQKKEFGHENII